MDVAINDLAFQRSLYNREDALRAVEKFICIYHGYEDYNLPPNILTELNQKIWD